jgi:molybdate transport system regulatory protein
MKKEIRIRCWIDVDGEKFFGPGRAELLDLIGKTGSIAKAAKSMGMSYKKAWDMVNEMNTLGRKPYVVSHAGGDKGGGAQVTEAGNNMLSAYKKIVDQLDSISANNKDILKLI